MQSLTQVATLTRIHQPKVRWVACLRDELVDGILHAQRLVEFTRDHVQRAVSRFVRRVARQVDAECEAERLVSQLGRFIRKPLRTLDLDLARRPTSAIVMSTETCPVR